LLLPVVVVVVVIPDDNEDEGAGTPVGSTAENPSGISSGLIVEDSILVGY
jgi:hypothetical protein